MGVQRHEGDKRETESIPIGLERAEKNRAFQTPCVRWNCEALYVLARIASAPLALPREGWML